MKPVSSSAHLSVTSEYNISGWPNCFTDLMLVLVNSLGILRAMLRYVGGWLVNGCVSIYIVVV
jgi:hypothetical protein